AKKNLTKLPFSVGNVVAQIPYEFRPGLSHIYRKRKAEIRELSKTDIESKKNFVFSRVKAIATFAYENVPFYQKLYVTSQVDPRRFRVFSDLKELPIISKSDLQACDLEERSTQAPTRSIVNTG